METYMYFQNRTDTKLKQPWEMILLFNVFKMSKKIPKQFHKK